MTDDTVQRALSKVIADLPAIGKGDKSPQGYSFRGIEAITKHLQPLLAKHGVVIVPNCTVTNVVPSPAMKEAWQDVYVAVQWTIYGPDGSSITACTTGIGRDNADKGVNKGQTQAFKYLLLHMLCIADAKDDADQSDYSHGYGERRQAPPVAPAASSKAIALFERVKATKGTPVADELRALAAENNRKLTAADLDADPHWAALVFATLADSS